MARTAKKKEYKVTVEYAEHTPEEAERIRQEIAAEIYRIKMKLMKQREQAG